MTDDDLQKPLETPPALLDHRVVEAVQVDFARERRDANAGGFALEEVAEDFEVRVPTADFGAPEFEGGDVGGQADEVGRVAGGGGGGWLVGLRVGDLLGVGQRGGKPGQSYCLGVAVVSIFFGGWMEVVIGPKGGSVSML